MEKSPNQSSHIYRKLANKYEVKQAASDNLTKMEFKLAEVRQSCMQNYCCCYDINFQSVSKTQEDANGQNLQENVHLILTDPSYNITYNKDYKNPVHDRITVQDMKKLEDFSRSVLTT